MWEVCFLLNTTRLSCRILDLRNMESAGLVSLIFGSSLSFPHSQALQTIQLGCMMVLLLLYSRVTVEPICGCSVLASNTWGASKILPEKSSFSFSKKDYSHFVVYMFFFPPGPSLIGSISLLTEMNCALVTWLLFASGFVSGFVHVVHLPPERGRFLWICRFIWMNEGMKSFHFVRCLKLEVFFFVFIPSFFLLADTIFWNISNSLSD